MSRQWQQTKYKNLVLPEAVYYQSIWAVRDLQRRRRDWQSWWKRNNRHEAKEYRQ